MDDDTKFKEAMTNGDCDVVDSMLAQGHIPKPEDITIPCETGNLDMLIRLTNFHMDLQLGLLTAVKSKNSHLLNHLFVAGADVNFRNSHDRNALHYVQDPVTCKWLLDMGVEQTPDNKGDTPLNRPYNQNAEVFLTLLQTAQGVKSINKANHAGDTPLSRACCYENIDLVKILLGFPEGLEALSKVDNCGYTPLHWTCVCGNIDITALILSYPEGRATLSMTNSFGRNPLQEACYGNFQELRDLILTFPEGRAAMTAEN